MWFDQVKLVKLASADLKINPNKVDKFFVFTFCFFFFFLIQFNLIFFFVFATVQLPVSLEPIDQFQSSVGFDVKDSFAMMYTINQKNEKWI